MSSLRVPGPRRILCFSTRGAGSNEEERIVELLQPLEPRTFRFDRSKKGRGFARLLGTIWRQRPELVVMEGTGLGGGLAILLARLVLGIPFVFSSGDAVGPFLGLVHPLLRRPGLIYERLLYRCCAGFIGWTPYLVGRAFTYGAPRALTAAGWGPYPRADDEREGIRRHLGIPEDAVVFGLVGALHWNARVTYCYGAELVHAIKVTERSDVYVVVVGDGTGRVELERLAGAELGRRVLLPGSVPQSAVPAYLAAMDVGSLPQSVDQVGALRYTTKISEYIRAGVPIVTGQIPLAYDLGPGWIWRLPGDAPWEPRYVQALADLMSTITAEDIAQRRSAVPLDERTFDRQRQQAQVSAFVIDVLAR